MLGLLGTLNMASQSMQTQMMGVEVTGQNLANVNTAGYTRQSVDIQASPDISTVLGPEGTGADVASIQQTVNAMLTNQLQGQQSVNGYWNSQQTALQNAQDSLDEFLSSTATNSSSSSTDMTTSSGLSTMLTNFFDDFQSVATSPTSVSARQTLIGDAQSLTAAFNQISAGLSQQNTALNTSLSTDVTSANQLLTGIANLNGEISSAEFGGGNANDLIDERQDDLNNLAQLTDISTSSGSNGTINVSVDGQTLVSGNQVLDTLQTYDPGNGNLLVQTATGGVNLTLSGGSMQGTIDARDGALASLQSSLNSLASSIITQVNSIYSGGYSLTGTTGADFFTGTNAADIAVNSSLTEDPSAFQASGSASSSADNSVALQLAQLGSDQWSSLNNLTFGDWYTESVGNFGSALQSANEQVTNQTSVTNMLTNQQASVSGVNIDQEMTNLLGFQQAYEASAELVSTVNQMMGDTLQMSST